MMLRKNHHPTAASAGAVTQAMVMSVYRKLNLHSHNPLKTRATTLRTRL